jgi:heterodisulfide reductase subunit A-like polyferredoxin
MSRYIVVIGGGPAGNEAARAAAAAGGHVTSSATSRWGGGQAGTACFPAKYGWQPPTPSACSLKHRRWGSPSTGRFGLTLRLSWIVFGP